MTTSAGTTMWAERMRVKIGDNLAMVSVYVMKWTESTDGYL